jgi:flagellar biosynthesis protein FliR
MPEITMRCMVVFVRLLATLVAMPFASEAQ